MAIGVAVDILGCTGSLEERSATLNRIILVAQELKDSMGDLYAFSSIMKALDMPQVSHPLDSPTLKEAKHRMDIKDSCNQTTGNTPCLIFFLLTDHETGSYLD